MDEENEAASSEENRDNETAPKAGEDERERKSRDKEEKNNCEYDISREPGFIFSQLLNPLPLFDRFSH